MALDTTIKINRVHESAIYYLSWLANSGKAYSTSPMEMTPAFDTCQEGGVRKWENNAFFKPITVRSNIEPWKISLCSEG